MSRETEYWCHKCDRELDTSTAYNHEFKDNYYCPDCYDICVVEEDE